MKTVGRTIRLRTSARSVRRRDACVIGWLNVPNILEAGDARRGLRVFTSYLNPGTGPSATYSL